MNQSELRDYYSHLTNMTSQVDTYVYAIEENIKGSSPHWHVHEAAISDARGHLAKLEAHMMPVIRWAEKARDINYEPSEAEKQTIYEIVSKAHLRLRDTQAVFHDRILPIAPPQWVEKVKLFIKQLEWYLKEIMLFIKPVSDN